MKKFLSFILVILIAFVFSITRVQAFGGACSIYNGETKTYKIGDTIQIDYLYKGTGSEDPLPLYVTGGVLQVNWDPNVLELVGTKDVRESMLEKGYSVTSSGSNYAKGISRVSFIGTGSTYRINSSAVEFYRTQGVMRYTFKVKSGVKTLKTIISSGKDFNSYMSCYDENYGYYEYCMSCSEEQLEYSIIGADSDNNLSSLKVNTGTLSPSFDSAITEYKVYVDNSVTSITLDAKCAGKNCSVLGIGKKSLDVGNNDFIISSKSESGTAKLYTVSVKRALKDKSNDATLRNLYIRTTENNYSTNYELEPNKLNYNLSVFYEFKKVDIYAACNDENCQADEIKSEPLMPGNNVIKLNSTAEDGTVLIYTFNIERNKPNEPLLLDLSVKGYELSPKFDVDKFEYTVYIDEKIDSLNIKYKPINEDYKVNINGNSGLSKGDKTILVVVTGLDYLVNTYKIKVLIKEKTYWWFLILIIILSLLFITFLSYILYKIIKKYKNKKNISIDTETNNEIDSRDLNDIDLSKTVIFNKKDLK